MSLPNDFDPAASLMQLGIAHSVQDVASALGMPSGGLFYVLKNADNGKYYQHFEIPKKKGGMRPIDRPVRGMALAQERLAAVINHTYRPKDFIHGYVRDRSFLTNARYHEKQNWVLNIDIQDFFGSIGFARIRGLFMSRYFGFNNRVSTILARLTTYQDKLPQGARTSPILANIIAHNLDKHLVSIAAKERLKFSRYADDITFSSDRKKIPPSLVKSWEPEYGDREIILGDKLLNAFKAASFEVNRAKTRIQLFGERQIVTGLVVNQKANVFRADISRLRMKLYSGKRFGPEQAAKVWIGSTSTADDYLAHINGWLGYIKQVRGNDDPVLSKLCKQAMEVNPNAPEWIKRHAEMVREFDIFLSHASEDKARVRRLNENLKAVGVKVFFDEESISWGDSIVERINHGLLKSTFFVPFLTNTFAAKGWTNKELNSAISANVSRKKRILPICDHDFHVGRNYPVLEDLLYKTWPSDPAEEQAWLAKTTDELLALVEKAKLENDTN